MNLSSGALRFQYFRQCLGGEARDTWDEVTAEVGGTAIPDFDAAMENFIRKFIQTTALADQTRYLSNTVKPYKLSVAQVSSRLKFINRLMALFPGANGALPNNESQMKLILYGIMLEDWRN